MKKKFTFFIASVATLLFVSLFVLLISKPSLFLKIWGVSSERSAPANIPSHTENIDINFTETEGDSFVTGWEEQSFNTDTIENSENNLPFVTEPPTAGTKTSWKYDNPSYSTHGLDQNFEKYLHNQNDINSDLGDDEITVIIHINTTDSLQTPLGGDGWLISSSISDSSAIIAQDYTTNLDVNSSAPGAEPYPVGVSTDDSLIEPVPEEIADLHRATECGNDNINLVTTVDTIPEPPTMVLLGSGLQGL